LWFFRRQDPAARPAAARAGDASAIGDDLATLSAELPVYTDEAATARADNRLGLPLGAAYLREASALMRGTLLPAASDIYTRESRRLTGFRRPGDRAAVHRGRRPDRPGRGLPALPRVPVAGPAYSSGGQLRVPARGLGGCRLAGVAGRRVRGGPGRSAARPASRVRPGAGVRPADVAVLQAHADESLTLVDNSGDDSYQQDFLVQAKLLGPGPWHAARRGRALRRRYLSRRPGLVSGSSGAARA